jgi:hypothetical protein
MLNHTLTAKEANELAKKNRTYLRNAIKMIKKPLQKGNSLVIFL